MILRHYNRNQNRRDEPFGDRAHETPMRNPSMKQSITTGTIRETGYEEGMRTGGRNKGVRSEKRQIDKRNRRLEE